MLQVLAGVVQNSRVKVVLKVGLAHGVLKKIDAIIVHQTDSESAEQTLNGYGSGGDGNGTHFLIGKDGVIYQTARLTEKCWHIGKIKSRCYETQSCVGTEKTFYEQLTKDSKGHYSQFVAKGYAHEIKKAYPDRYPSNEDAIGIELAGKKQGAADNAPFEKPTDDQQASLKWLIGQLLETCKLKVTDIYRHPDVSRKSPGEAKEADWTQPAPAKGAAGAKGVLFFLLLWPLTAHAQHYPLPAQAVVRGGASGQDASDPEARICQGFHLTDRQLRTRFRTYHLLRPGEMHDNYLIVPCWYAGEIVIQGATFTFKTSPGNTLFTTFPDGKAKMLGGVPSDSPSGR